MDVRTTGALTGLTEEDSNSNTFPIFGIETFAPNLEPGALQKIYGTKALPMFEWVRSIQTGTGTYDPENEEDAELMQEYEDFVATSGQPEGYMSPDELKQQMYAGTARAIGDVASVGIARGLTDPMLQQGYKIGAEGLTETAYKSADAPIMSFLERGYEGLKSIGRPEKLPTGFQKQVAQSQLDAVKSDNLNLPLDATDATTVQPLALSPSDYLADPTARATVNEARRAGANVAAEDSSRISDSIVSRGTARPSFFTKEGVTQAGYETGVSTLINLGVNLTLGKMEPKKAARQAIKSAAGGTVGSTVGAAVGTAVGGPIGGKIGSAVGKVIGSTVAAKVICNELERQGLMSRSQVLISYKFAKENLSEQHARGYHLWAIRVVQKMRKGYMVKFWQHIAIHRTNEIEYIYGKRDKPDYLGRLYRKIFEPACWVIGAFCKSSDWSILYAKES